MSNAGQNPPVTVSIAMLDLTHSAKVRCEVCKNAGWRITLALPLSYAGVYLCATCTHKIAKELSEMATRILLEEPK